MKNIDENGFWEIKNNPISRVGVFPYLGKNISDELEPDKIYYVYRPAEELFAEETLKSFNTAPVPLVNDHTMIGKGFTPAEEKGIHGVISNIRKDGENLVGDLAIYSEDMKQKISEGKKDLSMGYFCTYDLQEGTYNGQHYDAIQRDLRSNHVALVDEGRCGSSVRVYDHFVLDADFKEDEHPRDENGKFTSKGGAEKKTFSNGKIAINPMRIDSITDSEKDAIKDYTSQYSNSSYEDINKYLRTGQINDAFLSSNALKAKTDKIKKNIKELDSLMNKSSFQFDTELSRGTTLQEFEPILTKEEIENADFETIQKKLTGKQYLAQGFTSTSTDTEDNKFTNQSQVNMKILAPAGTQGVNLNELSSYGDESEVLLKRGTNFKITKVEQNDEKGQFTIYAEVIPDKKATPKPIDGDLIEKFKQNTSKSDYSQNFSDIENTLKKYPDGAKEIANIVAFNLIHGAKNDDMYKYLFEDSSGLSNSVNSDDFTKITDLLQNSISKISDLDDITMKDIIRIEHTAKENPTSFEARNEYEYVSNNLNNYVPKQKIIPTITSIFKKYNIDFSRIIDTYKKLQTNTAQDVGFVEFKEEEHPRKKDGKFAKKGQGEATGGKSESKEEKTLTATVSKSNQSSVSQAQQNQQLRYHSEQGQKDYNDYFETLSQRYSPQEKKAIHFFTELSAPINAYMVGEGDLDYEDEDSDYYEEPQELVDDNGEEYEGGIKQAVEDLKSVTEHPMPYDQELYRFATIQDGSCPELTDLFEYTLGYENYWKIVSGEIGDIPEDDLKKLIGEEVTFPTFISTSAREDWINPDYTNGMAYENFWANDNIYSIVFKINAPAGTLGADLGKMSDYPTQDEVLLAPDTTFKITNVQKDSSNGNNRLILSVDAISAYSEQQNRHGDNDSTKEKVIQNYLNEAAEDFLPFDSDEENGKLKEEYKIIKSTDNDPDHPIVYVDSLLNEWNNYSEYKKEFSKKELEEGINKAQQQQHLIKKRLNEIGKQYDDFDKNFGSLQKGEANFRLMANKNRLTNEKYKKQFLSAALSDAIESMQRMIREKSVS